MNGNKITEVHLQRRAVVYLRQSTGKQVRSNRESQALQYALCDRARDLGFSEVEVIDADLGTSAGVGAKRREGFDHLVSSVAVGQIGIILSREVSRLSRTDKDWCRLLEVCQVFGTLLGDAERVYDLGSMDDQLVLGIKGTLSVVELNTLRMRLLAGMEEKARRGELVRTLPVGYVRDNTGAVVKDPDRRVREAVQMLFAKFGEYGSIRQVFLWFRSEGMHFPVNKSRGGKMQVSWQLPKKSFLEYLMKNPFYAGVYCWGRNPVERIVVDGRVRKRQASTIEPEQCRVFIKDHHEGYIDWKRYQENRRIIAGNSLYRPGSEGAGAVKQGKALLVGVLRCGRCGRKLMVRYSGKASDWSGQYYCAGDTQNGETCPVRFGSVRVDRRFTEEILRAISPLGVEASLEALVQMQEADEERRGALQAQLEQAEYRCMKAFEQYDEVDPRNRLVAGELERRWNEKLREVDELKERIAAAGEQWGGPTEAERNAILQLGEEFGSVWENPQCPTAVKKRIVRTIIEEVIADCDEQAGTLTFIIHWKGGCHTRLEMPSPKALALTHKTAEEDVEIIRKMAQRYSDRQIVMVLNRLGHRTGRGNRWTEVRVRYVRSRFGIKGHRKTVEDPETLTLAQAAKHCGVSRTSLMQLAKAGLLDSGQVVACAPWEIRRNDLDTEPLRGILARLRTTGALDIEGGVASGQKILFDGAPEET
jgi:DNA invertase Pin-like site-specific DNA recombinase